MSDTYNNTNKTPSNDDSLLGAFRQLARSINLDLETALPCRVSSVSDDRTRVDVDPLIAIVGSSGELTTRATIYDIPVLTAGGGAFLISFPIAVGDLGWIQACDRDISLFLQQYSDVPPNTGRVHSFSDSRFIPDIMRGFTIDDDDESAMVIQNSAGTVRISLRESSIYAVAGSSVVDMTSDAITATSTDIYANGAHITSAGDVVTASGVSLDNHTHEQGTDSDGNTQVSTNTPTPTEI